MQYSRSQSDTTICAIATPPGGALGVIRVSGPQAIAHTAAIFHPNGHRSLAERAAGTVAFGTIVDPAQPDEVVDEVLVSLFRAPRSYTGEDSTEISCHGSSYILERVLHLLIAQGCVMARPGEYTQRAFLNGKMDLTRAEAVADLIASTTEANHRMAMRQMRGAFSNELKGLRDKLLHITALLELELDFSDHEDLEFASRDELLSLAGDIHARLRSLCAGFKLGNALKRGVPIAIVGETNAGKSTLLNALLGEERALVSNVHGTTRDTVEETLVIRDTLVRFIDTAGIRATDDTVERMGIERTFDKMREADLVLLLLDATCAREQYERLSARLPQTDAPVLILVNKADLIDDTTRQAVTNELRMLKPAVSPDGAPFFFSAQAPADVEALRVLLAGRLHATQQAMGGADGLLVSNVRHYEALTHALAAIDRVADGLHAGLSGDFIAQDLRECIHYLSEIIGEVTSDAVLHHVFEKFCVGK